MEMIGHEYNTDATGTGSLEHEVQNSQNDSLHMIVVQQSSPPVYGKRDEVGIQGIIKDITFYRCDQITQLRFLDSHDKAGLRNHRLIQGFRESHAAANSNPFAENLPGLRPTRRARTLNLCHPAIRRRRTRPGAPSTRLPLRRAIGTQPQIDRSHFTSTGTDSPKILLCSQDRIDTTKCFLGVP